jgi:ABC transport system ATP-binding/permease protein
VLLAVVGVTVVTMLLGLLISGAIGNADRAMPLLVGVLMIELVNSGGLFPVFDRPGLEQLAWLVPSRWAFAMGAVTADLNVTAREGPDPLWTHDAAHYLLGAGVLVGMSLVLVVVTGLVIRRLDPVRRRR